MTIRFNPDAGTWYFRFSRGGRSCYKGGFRTKRQAEEAQIKTLDKAIREEFYPEPAGRDMTFSQAGSWFFENHSFKRKRSWKNDRARIGIMVRFFGDKRLSEIVPSDVASLREHLKGVGRGAHTANHYQALLKSIYNRLKRFGLYLGQNPACMIEMEKVPRMRTRFLYPREEHLLTPAAREVPQLWPYYFAALHTGMRIKELCNMRVEHISLAFGSLFVPNSKNSRSRYVPVSGELAAFLEKVISGKRPQDYALGGYGDQWVRRMFRNVCERVGLENLLFHDLRHTFTQRLLIQGVPIYKISKILGHSSVVVTEQHYGHLCMSDLKSAVDQIDGIVSTDCSQVAVCETPRLVETPKSN